MIAAALACGVAAISGAEAAGSNQFQLTVRGYVPVNCKLDLSQVTVQPASAGQVNLGAVGEFCNTHNYRIMVDFDPILLSGARVNLGADGVTLGATGSEMITQGVQPTIRSRPISVTLNRQLQTMATIALRIEAAI
ncbi:MAG: hypothetical protein QM698_07035 [Micropepsaceae bacterium]